MHFFCRTPFAVTPDKWEINEGVLFPANRLTPFLSEDVFPSDAELLFDGEAVPKKEITMPFGEALRYLNLIGHEQVLDYLEADSDANDNLSEHLSPTTLVTMTVFDCRELFEELSKTFNVDFDETGSIGKRYRRQDEIGTPVCITYDFDSLEDGCVTVRDRDTMEQQRIKIENVASYISEKIAF